MRLCVFNPEHDLCLAKGRWNYVPPRSAVEFARRDANIMSVLYPGAVCTSVYDLNVDMLSAEPTAHQIRLYDDRDRDDATYQPINLSTLQVIAWGWDAVVKHELRKRGVPESLLPSDDEIATIRDLQHRSTVLPLQPDCHEVRSVEEMESLLREREHWVMKAPWSGAGRGLRWVHGSLTPIDRDWLLKTVASQRCVIVEPNRREAGDRSGASPSSVADLALEYNFNFQLSIFNFLGYSYFKTGSGVYKENIPWTDAQIEAAFPVREARERIEPWLAAHVWPRYKGPLGVDLMACADGSVHVAEINFRHTMGMVAHERIEN